MFKKITLSLSAIASLFAVAACSSSDNRVQRAEIWQPHINMPGSVVVCRAKQCAPAKISMSKEYIYNSLMHLLDNNAQNKALICSADPSSHVCTENYITLPITVGVTPANMYIDDVKITDVSASLGNKSLNLVLNYNVTYNGQYPTCKPAETLVYVKNSNNIILEDAGYTCKMTTIGNTTIKTLFAIDYIDLDYGYIGGYYSIGLSGPAYGGGSGYMLLRLPKDAYPLTPVLMGEEEKKPEAEPAPAEEVKTEEPAKAEKAAQPNVKEQQAKTPETKAKEPAKAQSEQPEAQSQAKAKQSKAKTASTKDSKDIQPVEAKVTQSVNTQTTPHNKTVVTTAKVKTMDSEKAEMFHGVKVFPIIKKKAPETLTLEANPADNNSGNAKGGTLKDAMKKLDSAGTDKAKK